MLIFVLSTACWEVKDAVQPISWEVNDVTIRFLNSKKKYFDLYITFWGVKHSSILNDWNIKELKSIILISKLIIYCKIILGVANLSCLNIFSIALDNYSIIYGCFFPSALFFFIRCNVLLSLKSQYYIPFFLVLWIQARAAFISIVWVIVDFLIKIKVPSFEPIIEVSD